MLKIINKKFLEKFSWIGIRHQPDKMPTFGMPTILESFRRYVNISYLF